MKGTLFFICTMLAFAGSTFADDTFSVDNIMLPQNGEADVVVRFSLDEGSTCSGYTFWLQVPEELAFVTYEKNGKTNITFTAGDCYDDTPTITPNIDGGYLKVGCLTANSDPINGQTGILVTFRLKVVGAVEVGEVLEGKLLNGIISAENGTIHDVADATFTVTIDEPDDGRIKFDENSTTLPTYTAGEKADIRMTRTIKANQWSTIVLPFTLTKAKAEAVFGSDVQLAEFSGFVVDYGDDEENIVPLGITLNFTSYTIPAQGGRLEGGTPVLIKTSKDITEPFELDDVNLTEDIKDVKVDFVLNEDYTMHGKFTGTLVKTKVPADGLFISDEKFYYSTGATNIKAFRGWFELEAVLDKETDFGVKMFVDDIETKVDGISVRDAEGIIYDLSGRKVNSPSRRGVYIVNGKKVMK